LTENGIVPLQGLEEAIFALGASHWYAGQRALSAARAEAGGLAIAAVPALSLDAAGHTLDEWDSKALLAGAGVRVPEGMVVAGKDAPAAARRMGFPVVVKAVSETLAHKSDAGAVALNLESEAAVAAVVAGMAGLSTRFLVERMALGGVAEVIVGIKRDPQFGLVLVVGSGGVLVNLIEDAARLLLPLDRGELERALNDLRLARILEGYRGHPRADRAALLDMVAAIAALAEEEQARLLELDVNPIIVMPEGEGAVAVDALIHLADNPGVDIPGVDIPGVDSSGADSLGAGDCTTADHSKR
jgi:acetyl-CoA synthetase